MEYKQLGKSPLEVSRIGFGAWAAGGGGWAFGLGPQDDAESISAIRRAIDLGINWIDTAPLYGLGHSEQIVARALDGLSDKPYVFTKCGMPWDAVGKITHNLRSESIRTECESSLRRLRTECIDLYQIHWNKPAEQVDEALRTLDDLHREGKIAHVGVSNFTRVELERAISLTSLVSVQPPYSLLDREIEAEILPFCTQNSLGVIVYSPMKSGLLSGNMTAATIPELPDDDLRKTKPEFQEPQLSSNLALTARLRQVGGRYGRSAAETAVAWTLNNPAVTGTIVGLRRPQHVDGIIGAVEYRLSAADLAEIEGIVPVGAIA